MPGFPATAFSSDQLIGPHTVNYCSHELDESPTTAAGSDLPIGGIATDRRHH